MCLKKYCVYYLDHRYDIYISRSRYDDSLTYTDILADYRSERRAKGLLRRRRDVPTFHSLLSFVVTKSDAHTNVRHARGVIKKKRGKRRRKRKRTAGSKSSVVRVSVEIMSLTRRWSPAWAGHRWSSALRWTSKGSRDTS